MSACDREWPGDAAAGGRRALAFAIAILASMILIGCNDKAGDPVLRISYSHAPSDESDIHAFATAFVRELEKEPDAPEIELYAANALGEEREVFEGMQLGAGASCAISGTAILSSFDRRIGVLDYPYLWADASQAREVLSGEVGQELAEYLQLSGFTVIEWLDSWGMRSIVTARANVKSPQDIAGLKLRTIPSPTYIAAMESMGAIPSPMDFGEIHSSLETGVIDGFEHTPSVVIANRFYEVTEQLVRTDHIYGPLVFICSTGQLDKFTDEQRIAIRSAAQRANAAHAAQTEKRIERGIDLLKAQGMQIVEIDTTTFRERAAAARTRLAQRYDVASLLSTIEAQTAPENN